MEEVELELELEQEREQATMALEVALEAAEVMKAVRMAEVGLLEENPEAAVETPQEEEAIQKGCLELIQRS